MGKRDWKAELRGHFDNIRVLERCQGETVAQFAQFCEFIAEPAFENLTDELDLYGVRSRHQKTRVPDIRFIICFPGTKEDQFHYRVSLPKNAVELRLKLTIRGRRTPKAEYQINEEIFLPEQEPSAVLKMDKEDIIHDVIEHYRKFCYETLTSPD
jgi:hypothetical protein